MDVSEAFRENGDMAEKVRTRFKPTRRTFIREWREHRGYTLEELGEIVGCTAGAISNVERMASGYTQGMLEALADALNCKPSDLIDRDPRAPNLDSILRGASDEQRRMIIDVARRIMAAA